MYIHCCSWGILNSLSHVTLTNPSLEPTSLPNPSAIYSKLSANGGVMWTPLNRPRKPIRQGWGAGQLHLLGLFRLPFSVYIFKPEKHPTKLEQALFKYEVKVKLMHCTVKAIEELLKRKQRKTRSQEGMEKNEGERKTNCCYRKLAQFVQDVKAQYLIKQEIR